VHVQYTSKYSKPNTTINQKNNNYKTKFFFLIHYTIFRDQPDELSFNFLHSVTMWKTRELVSCEHYSLADNGIVSGNT
jgi:hypothetical protein